MIRLVHIIPMKINTGVKRQVIHVVRLIAVKIPHRINL
jgi:hypothetical protein